MVGAVQMLGATGYPQPPPQCTWDPSVQALVAVSSP